MARGNPIHISVDIGLGQNIKMLEIANSIIVGTDIRITKVANQEIGEGTEIIIKGNEFKNNSQLHLYRCDVEEIILENNRGIESLYIETNSPITIKGNKDIHDIEIEEINIIHIDFDKKTIKNIANREKEERLYNRYTTKEEMYSKLSNLKAREVEKGHENNAKEITKFMNEIKYDMERKNPNLKSISKGIIRKIQKLTSNNRSNLIQPLLIYTFGSLLVAFIILLFKDGNALNIIDLWKYTLDLSNPVSFLDTDKILIGVKNEVTKQALKTGLLIFRVMQAILIYEIIVTSKNISS